MIVKAMQAITGIVIPIAGAGCVLSAANNHLSGGGVPAPSRVGLLSCVLNYSNGFHCPPTPPQYGPDGCPVPTAFNRDEHELCVLEKEGEALLTPGPGPGDFLPKPKPGPVDPGEIFRDAPK
jgi:hypothetical protein